MAEKLIRPQRRAPKFSQHLAQHLAQQRLVAYVIPTEDRGNVKNFNSNALQDSLKAQLPNHMVPAAIVPLETLPRNANGKIDINALPVPLFSTNAIGQAPRTETEATLARIWQNVLHLDDLGIHDNFFELGGDSILSIQIVSRAREAGLELSPNQLFEYPTIAELAQRTNEQVPEILATQELVTGEVPLTPIQHWFFEQQMAAPHHWHQARLVTLPEGCAVEDITGAIATLWTHHDALRLTFTASGPFQQDVSDPPPLQHIDLSHLSPSGQQAAVSAHSHRLCADTQLENGLMSGAYFHREEQPPWLLLTVHHLAVDAVSWQILLDDLARLLIQAQPLPPKTTAFKTWAELLPQHILADEVDFWLAQVGGDAVTLPQSVSDSPMTEATAATVTAALSAADTQALLQQVPAVYNTQINDVLLLTLAQTLLEWVEQTSGKVQVEVESYGRDAIALASDAHSESRSGSHIDLSRTVGWFTTTYPIQLSLQETPLGDALKSVKEQLRQVPRKGLGYGLLRYLGTPTIQAQLAQHQPAILFNYLGQIDRAQNPLLPVQDLDIDGLRDPQNARAYAHEVNAWITDNSLQVHWTYDGPTHSAETMNRLAQRYIHHLKTLIHHCTASQGGFTPSDFPEAGLEQAPLDDFLERLSQVGLQDIEAIYPLTSLQQAFLWHGLQTSLQAGLLHVRCTIQGAIDVQRLRQAWEIVVAQHPVLRSSVHWQDLAQPLQVVAPSVTVPWVELDARDPAQPCVEDFLAVDAAHPLPLSQPPIMRLTLIRLTKTTYELVWTCHHLMLDGWSAALVINQVLEAYEKGATELLPVRPPTPTYHTYTRWLTQQDPAPAKAFWQATLAGYHGQLLPIRSEPKASERASVSLESSLSQAVTEMLRSYRLTLNTLMQAIWALCLYQYSGQQDILFGATVSGRQGDLAGVESIVGLLINVLPVRVKISLEQVAVKWLQALQTQQLQASQHAHASLAQIQTWSGLAGNLFNSLLVIENYPVPTTDTHQSLLVKNLQSGIVSTYGLTLVVKPGDPIELHLEGNQLAPSAMADLLKQFRTLLSAIVNQPDQPLQSLVPQPTTPISTDAPLPNLSRDTLEGHFTAPAYPLELKLAQIWADMLDVYPLSVTDSFFDLGGNSLLAVQLFNQMQTQLNCDLPLAALFQAPTVRQFAALLSEQTSLLQWKSLVPIQTSGTGPPLFFHGGSADALTWARFSHLLGSDQPFYALQRPDLDGSNVVHHTVEALAADCIKEIRMVQPSGPYLVGGHCFGGAVAFEIAQQLQAVGEDVIDVILVDAYRPEDFTDRPLAQRQLQLQQAYFWLRKNYYYHIDLKNSDGSRLAQLPAKIWQRFIKVPGNTLQENNRSAGAIAEKEPSPTAVPAPSRPYEYRYARAQAVNEVAAAAYLAQPYAGHITLFRAQIQTLDWYFGRALGWQTVAKQQIELMNIPGFFGNLFNQRSGPHLAQAVQQHLAQYAETS
ncbi:MAG: alpha/beta fold hydrolase [Cyanobacteria bacterium J06632_22]